jgi:hypothetical protein
MALLEGALLLANFVVGASSCPAAPLTGDSVGAVAVGAPVSRVRARCEVVRDTTELDSEAMPQRVLYVRVGADTITAEVADGKVWRINVADSRLQTADGIHVGSPLRALVSDARPSGLVGEGELYVVSAARCGMSFLVDPTPSRLGRRWNADALRSLSRRTVIKRILLTGCKAA